MRNGGRIHDRTDFHAHGLDSADGDSRPGPGPFDNKISFLHAHLLGGFDGLFSSQACSKGRALARAFEASRTSRTPSHCVARSIGHRDNGVVERGKDMNLPRR
jgi:hypothetical protein